ncbi:hypothetical protein [Serinicoccus kebangsaanensis]|uniref:hypothetical protein n=1 Tax=Serinicoccus kebangsaanensis TaxID=2602069 RepID=UPI00124D56C7|nr:hypothetical protein [Serinicoccus kebangsaanensis]
MRVWTQIAGVLLGAALLASCASTQGEGTSPKDRDTPGASSSSSASDTTSEGAAGAEQEGAPATPSTPVAGSNAPDGYVELRGEGADAHAAMTDGDGTAEPQLLREPPLPEAYETVEADGPKFVQQICGVQLDPVEPSDAAHRRWGDESTFTQVTSEVHTFADDTGAQVAEQVTDAVQGCAGYALTEDGEEVELGAGAYDVTVEAGPVEVDGWTTWTERTEGVGQVRHYAFRAVDGGWHWVGYGNTTGAPLDLELFASVLRQAG